MQSLYKTFNKINIIILLIFFSCSPKEEDEINIGSAPTEDEMSFTYIEEDNNTFIFENTSSVDSYAYWDFGNDATGSGNTDTVVYKDAGDYVVSMTIIARGGSGTITNTVSVANDYEYTSIVENGGFDDGDNNWNSYSVGSGVDVSISDGKATWSGGNWAQAIIYQAIEIEKDVEYQVDMEISGSGTTDSWFEVYFSTTPPTEGEDYTGGDVLLGLNTWSGCGSDEFDGDFTDISCSDNGDNGKVTFDTTGTAYLVIKGGGSDLGTTGITVDNVVVYSTEE